jgi:hypothetical protein
LEASIAPATGTLLDSPSKLAPFLCLIVQIPKYVLKICSQIIKDGNTFIVGLSV